jgi:hypothetical protein
MSIIQEALRKAQKINRIPPRQSGPLPEMKTDGGQNAERTVSVPVSSHAVRIGKPGIAFLLVLSAILLTVILKDIVLKKPVAIEKTVSPTLYAAAASPRPADKRPAAQPTSFEHKDTLADSFNAITESMKIHTQQKFVLSGIMELEDGPRAIINDSIVAEGDKIGSATVTRIARKSVILDNNGSAEVLDLR